jgi:hypothetical protein
VQVEEEVIVVGFFPSLFCGDWQSDIELSGEDICETSVLEFDDPLQISIGI